MNFKREVLLLISGIALGALVATGAWINSLGPKVDPAPGNVIAIWDASNKVVGRYYWLEDKFFGSLEKSVRALLQGSVSLNQKIKGLETQLKISRLEKENAKKK